MEQPKLRDQHYLVPIFAGGGTRLPAHIGILQALTDLNVRFDHLVGVSGGSIISSLYASGLSLTAIKKIALETDFEQFKGFSILSLLRNGGLCSGDKFEAWLDEKLQGKCFKDLPIKLHVVATDVRSGTPVVFDAINTPNEKVSRAVRFSMSIPLIFAFKPYENHLMVDGSILSEDALHQDWDDNGTPVICFRLRGDGDNQPINTNKIFPLASYISLLIRTFMTTISREYVNEKFWHRTIVVNTGNTSPVDFRMSMEDKTKLYAIGYETALSVVPIKVWQEAGKLNHGLDSNNIPYTI
ncbi:MULTISPECIES: patatin-like phospholipase family protein [unclassified Motilimonas]|uniref:patatin-like phospholipase family protein n=1 Tax=unclassified Motilimonas TaxID=2643697 RepID=UPI001E62785F|nr:MULTISPECIES: patatin-like phospholipase family protein [unclassified Motilimonas]MCE0557199.1 patatin-like phospholipase family protein [Motilimonas sp. E26]MDO6524442.1 patatin-like phospholipase family protein [Motilimonas sp. 1_MG-2023]